MTFLIFSLPLNFYLLWLILHLKLKGDLFLIFFIFCRCTHIFLREKCFDERMYVILKFRLV